MIRYYHAATGFPTKTTWIKAIKAGNYATWPGLTTNAVRKHFPESEETQKGHMRKEPSGIRSTKKRFNPKRTNEVIEESDDPKQQNEKYKKNKDIFVRVIDLQDEFQQRIYLDQTGKFPTTSSKGNQYIMVMAEMDSNTILVEPMRNRTAGEMVRAYQKLI